MFTSGQPLQVGRSIPVIILTGDISTATSGAINEFGFVRLVKPVKLEELMGVTQELLQPVPPADAAQGR